LPNTSHLKTFYLLHLSKPTLNRPIYKAIVRKKVCRILELGIADCTRALRMVDAAARYTPRTDIQYVGMDRFEDRNESDGPGLSLIEAHRILKACGARIKLVPGDPLNNFARNANDLGQFDLLIISSQFGIDRLKPVWFFIPRLLHAKSLIFVENNLLGERKSLQTLSQRDINQLASKAIRWKAA
jgi:hypothetical protein